MPKSPSPSRASLVRHSLYKLNIIGDKQHPCRTPLQTCTLLVSPRSSRILTLWSMYSFLINLISRQSIPVLFRICINLVQFTRSNTFCQSMTQTHSPSSTSKVRSDIILIIPIASLVPFPLLNPNWSPSTSSIFLSIHLLSIFAIIFAVCAKVNHMGYTDIIHSVQHIMLLSEVTPWWWRSTACRRENGTCIPYMFCKFLNYENHIIWNPNSNTTNELRKNNNKN